MIRHGDDGSAFKLNYPPVEKGSQRVKHYNPDYIPTIRKRMFWVIEAKSAKDVAHPFEAKYLVQGFQYCIHPEIQAKYLLVTNGLHSCVYDAHGAIFLDKDIYEPIFEFRPGELVDRWPAIFHLLSVETMRTRIETDLKSMYDKLCLSSLDARYPQRLLRSIGASAGQNSKHIEAHVRKLYLDGIEKTRRDWQTSMEKLDANEIYGLMDVPLLGGGKSEGRYFVDKSLAAGATADSIFHRLTNDFDSQCMLRKLQTYVAVCHLYYLIKDEIFKERCRAFLKSYGDAELPLINQLECAYLRVTRKISVLNLYPPLRERLRGELKTASELARFVHPPTAFSSMYPLELAQNRRMFAEILMWTDERRQTTLKELLLVEQKIESDFQTARSNLPNDEIQIGGFESYGVGGKHYAFRNIPINLGVLPSA